MSADCNPLSNEKHYEIVYSDVEAASIFQRIRNLNLFPNQEMFWMKNDALYFLTEEPERRLQAMEFSIQRSNDEKLKDFLFFGSRVQPYTTSLCYGNLTFQNILNRLDNFLFISGYEERRDDILDELYGMEHDFSEFKRNIRMRIAMKMKMEKNIKDADFAKMLFEKRLHWSTAYRKYQSDRMKGLKKLFSFSKDESHAMIVMAMERTGVYVERNPLIEARRFGIPLEKLVHCYTAAESMPQFFRYTDDCEILSGDKAEFGFDIGKEVKELEESVRNRILAQWADCNFHQCKKGDISKALPATREEIYRLLRDCTAKSIDRTLRNLQRDGSVVSIKDKAGQEFFYPVHRG